MTESNIIEQDSFTQRIKFNEEKGKLMVFRKTRTYNYNKLYQRKVGRNPIRVKEEWLEIEEAMGKDAPKKQLELDIIIKRTATDTNTLKPLLAYFSQKLKISVFPNYPYLYLTAFHGTVFITDFERFNGVTQPLGLSKGFTGIKIEKGKEEKRLTKEEVKQLIKEGTPIFEEFADNELRALV